MRDVPSPKANEAALARIESLTSHAAAIRAANPELDTLQSLREICKVYRHLKPQIDIALKVVAGIGKPLGYDFVKVALALRKIFDLMDLLCL